MFQFCLHFCTPILNVSSAKNITNVIPNLLLKLKQFSNTVKFKFDK